MRQQSKMEITETMTTKTFIRRKFETDHEGFYILPILGYSNVKGRKDIWIGWGPWIWTWALNHEFDMSVGE